MTLQNKAAISPPCLPGRTHIWTVADDGQPFHSHVTQHCEVCNKTYSYDVPELGVGYHKSIKRPPAPGRWQIVDTSAHVSRTNRGRTN